MDALAHPVERAPAPWPARLRAAGLDALVLACGVAAVGGVGFGLRAPAGPGASAPGVLTVDVAGLGLLVLPAWLYLTAGEAGRAHGTWGKRRAGLHVTTAAGVPAGTGRICARNVVKLLPWQLAHVAVARLVLGVDAPITIAVTDAAALLLPVVSVAMALCDPARRGLHDRLAGTRVTATPAGGDDPSVEGSPWGRARRGSDTPDRSEGTGEDCAEDMA